MAKADVIPVNRDQLVGWLKKLQAGDVHDKKYQAELFDTFLIAVYVYDNPDGQNYMKVVFNYAGSKNTVEIPLDPSVIDNVENIETGAVRLSSAQVHQSNADFACVRFFSAHSIRHTVSAGGLEKAELGDLRGTAFGFVWLLPSFARIFYGSSGQVPCQRGNIITRILLSQE